MKIIDKYLKYFFGVLSFLIPFIVYLITLAPTVGFIDTGELAAVCIKLGIAHPTGYPLFTIIGNIFSGIPVGEGIYRLNLMSAFIGSVSVSVFYFLMKFLLSEYIIPREIIKKFRDNSQSQQNLILILISFTASVVLAFTIVYWSICNGIEVYALHIFFLITVSFAFLKACHFTDNGNPDKERYWMLFSFLLGLSFTNHLTTIFLAPSSVFLYFAVCGFNKLSFKRILIMLIPFIIGISVYVYFPLRADNPVISWGYPENMTNIIRHISGKQFSVWMFSSTDVMIKQINKFIGFYPKEFYYFPVIIAIAGIIYIFKYNRKFFYFTLVLFCFNILYASNYDIYDIESYFILAIITTAIWIGFGLLYIIGSLKTNKLAVSFVALSIPAIMLYQNYKECNESNNFFTYDYTMNVFSSARPNSLIISSQWDFWLSASWYFQYIHNLRPDVYVLDKELLRRSWYMRHIKNHYPVIYERSQNEFETYMAELIKFEDETPRYLKPKTELDKQDLVKINSAFTNLLNSFVEKNYHDRNIYTTYEIEQNKQEQFGKDFLRIPEGLLVRYTRDTGFDESYKEPEFKFEITKNPEYYYSFLMKTYYDSYIFRANYLMNFSKFDRAEELINKAAELDPQKQDARNLLKKLNELRTIQKTN